MTTSEVLAALLIFVLILPSIILHEISHGWVALMLGDTTARDAGRLTLNPLKHIDLWGTIVLPLVLLIGSGGQYAFGYAKPVPINPHRMRTGYQTGLLLTGIAGPITNTLLALVAGGLFRFMALIGTVPPTVTLVLGYFVFINLALAFFNLIPIPPFDGSRVFQWFLHGEALRWYYSIERYGFVIILLLIFVLPVLTRVDPVSSYLQATAFPIAKSIMGPAANGLFG